MEEQLTGNNWKIHGIHFVKLNAKTLPLKTQH